jgi:hypothetical protein
VCGGIGLGFSTGATYFVRTGKKLENIEIGGWYRSRAFDGSKVLCQNEKKKIKTNKKSGVGIGLGLSTGARYFVRTEKIKN